MPAKSEKSFRTAMVGGFNRQDVLDYISAVKKEHHNETDAYRAGAEKLRGERDALCRQVEELSSQRERADRLEREANELKREINELSRENSRLARKEEELTVEIGGLSLRILDFENSEKELGDARLRAEELEMQAYRRAEEIESEAARSVEKQLQGSREALDELMGKLDGIRLDAEKAAYQVVLELDKMRSWYAHYGEAFQETEDKLRELGGGDQPIVREFVPREF